MSEKVISFISDVDDMELNHETLDEISGGIYYKLKVAEEEPDPASDYIILQKNGGYVISAYQLDGRNR